MAIKKLGMAIFITAIVLMMIYGSVRVYMEDGIPGGADLASLNQQVDLLRARLEKNGLNQGSDYIIGGVPGARDSWIHGNTIHHIEVRMLTSDEDLLEQARIIAADFTAEQAISKVTVWDESKNSPGAPVSSGPHHTSNTKHP